MKRSAGSRPRARDSGKVRIIAGRCRGRILRFNAVEGLRPSGDRVRETLFNWLQPFVVGARCLDMFAGSGALGFEAASRGAARVDMYEQSAVATSDLSRNRDLLGVDEVNIHRENALHACRPQAAYDIVFVDPPFEEQLHSAAIDTLERNRLVANDSLVYLEWPRADGKPSVPAHWHVRREQAAGDVGFTLYTVGRAAGNNIASH